MSSQVEKRFHSVSFEKAQKMANTLMSQNPSPDLAQQCQDALACHPDNPANANVATATEDGGDGEVKSNGEKGNRVWEEVISAADGPSRAEITRRCMLPESDPEHLTFEQGFELAKKSELGDTVVYCTTATGSVVVRQGNRVTALHEERWNDILPHAAGIMEAIAKHHEQTVYARDHRTAPVVKRSFGRN